jgi:hypothetical protein
MKKSQKVFFAVICIGLIFACSKTDKTEWVKSKNVSVAWDAPASFEDGTAISQDVELRYNVYIDRDTDKTHDDKELVTKDPIAETQYTIDSIEHKGKYFIGIQALAYKVKDGKEYGDPKTSRISWSSNKADTKSGAFGIKIK